MGLWAQSVGVRGAGLPPSVLGKAGLELFGVPEQMEGWSWATLDDFVEFDELEALLVDATEHAQAPGLAFSVHDSDSVFLLGADTSGLRFVLVVNAEAWEDELPRQEVEEAVAWSKDHAPRDPSVADIEAVLERQFVFGEEGLDVLMATMGLIPAEAAEGAEELGDDLPPDLIAELWNTLETVASPEEHVLERGRWWTTLQHGQIEARLLAAEEAMTEAVVENDSIRRVTAEPFEEAVTGYAIRPGKPPVFLLQMPTREEVWDELTRQGVTLGSWEDVPNSVPRDLAGTAWWLLSS